MPSIAQISKPAASAGSEILLVLFRLFADVSKYAAVYIEDMSVYAV